MALTATFASKDTFAEAAVVADVAREIYSDGLLNWGRLVSLVAFGAALLGVSKASPERARNIGVTIAAYMTDTHMDWFVDNGGWEGFVCMFDRKTTQDSGSLTKGLMVMCSVGLTLLAIVIRST
ncbi:unnamed protein product [Oreochromis niloticus]|nr:unnamed protein product [Mustela putorius furo]